MEFTSLVLLVILIIPVVFFFVGLFQRLDRSVQIQKEMEKQLRGLGRKLEKLNQLCESRALVAEEKPKAPEVSEQTPVSEKARDFGKAAAPASEVAGEFTLSEDGAVVFEKEGASAPVTVETEKPREETLVPPPLPQMKKELPPLVMPAMVEEQPQPMSFDQKAGEIFRRGWNWFWLGKEEYYTGDDVESLVAANWLTRIGMVLLVIGLGFFIKYSIDGHWLSPEVRLVGAFGLGLAMYAFGMWLWRGTMNLIGQAFTAGGAAVLYFAAYASSEMYGLTSPYVACGGAVLITALLVASALRRDSQLLASLGMLGAYSTPLMFGIRQENPYPILIYLAALALGLLVIRRSQKWILPVWIAFLGSAFCSTLVANAMVWDENFVSSLRQVSNWWSNDWQKGWAIPFLAFGLGYYLLFHLAAQRRFRKLTEAGSFWELLLVGVNTLFFMLYSLDIIGELDPAVVWGWDIQIWFKLVLFGTLTLVFFGLTALLRARREEEQLFWAIDCGLGFLSLALLACFVWSGEWLVPFLMFECVIMQWVVLRMGSRVLTGIAYFAATLILGFWIVCACVAYSLDPGQFFESRVLSECTVLHSPLISDGVCWIERAVRFLIPALCAFAMVWNAWKFREPRRSDSQDSIQAVDVVGVLGTLLLLVFLTAEVVLLCERYCDAMRLGAVSVLWTLFALGLILFGMRAKVRAARITGLVFLLLVMLKVFLVDMAQLDQIYRVVAFVVLGGLVLLGGVLYLHRHAKSEGGAELESDTAKTGAARVTAGGEKAPAVATTPAVAAVETTPAVVETEPVETEAAPAETEAVPAVEGATPAEPEATPDEAEAASGEAEAEPETSEPQTEVPKEEPPKGD